ncbi:hypothetical protein [Methanocorpusculum vombati]|uniref:Uncharacterized protein n=1 Tax=Methanocorpusculum vombati TaxID=3002864 RepID=A0ABT4ILI3_9EURY|nr:hypothetical protein [Methanocorpusculum vombati]MCZ9320117.1 hypothetical protein [Methanocorpusculum sp.]MCZ0862204.1 hypothetical protein [Methanocorpusculum vombati]MDE2519682.1 hypothetical protein [Methanocorpusculum sp.]MDE2533467.1 hypothetical protein [Methanocorpusculum sp.]MDE2545244.1 hypothetical protein [Methanocorpusculum sp.]
MKLLECETQNRCYTCFAVLLATVVFATVFCIAPVAADVHDEFSSGEVWIQDAEDNAVLSLVDDDIVNGDIPLTSMRTIYRGAIYDPADFTITAFGPDLSPEDLFETANATLSNYTALFGNSVAPVALPNSFLSSNILSQRKTVSENALFASPIPDGYVGIPGVKLPEGKKLAAYAFRVLPTGQTMMYASAVSADASNTAYAAARENLNKWVNTTLKEKTKSASESLVALAADMPPISPPKLIGESYLDYSYKSDKTNEVYGRIEFTSKWYWDSIEDIPDKDYFFTTSYLKMTPGKYLGSSDYKNIQFTLKIDANHPTPWTPAIPYVHSNNEQPQGSGSGTQMSCSLSTSSVGISWVTDVPDTSLVFGRPGDQVSKWDGKFDSHGNFAKQTFIFQAGEEISGKEVRDGKKYVLSENVADLYKSFGYTDQNVHPPHVYLVPDSHELYCEDMCIQWNDEKYKQA